MEHGEKMNIFEEAKHAVEEISLEPDFFKKAELKKRAIIQKDCTFAGH